MFKWLGSEGTPKSRLIANIVLIVIIGVGIILNAPDFYKKHIRSATIEDCADFVYMTDNVWKPSFVEASATDKLQTDIDYERAWERCESDKKKYPEKFKNQFSDMRSWIDDTVSKEKNKKGKNK